MSRLTEIALLTLALAALLPSFAEAACSISTTGVSFGAYDAFGTSPVDSTGSVRYQCTGSVDSFTISLSQGSSGTFNPRSMVLGNSALNYNLYLDGADTSIWGDGTAAHDAPFTMRACRGSWSGSLW